MDEGHALGNGICQIHKISTVVDGSVRITLDVSPNETELIQNLFGKKIKNDSGMVAVAFVDVLDNYDGW